MLDRPRVADEVKGLEQPERANLRKYGVRFGAYNIYLPLLLKPAPRALAVQLWALSHDGPQSKGLDDLLHLAGSGRTSIPANQRDRCGALSDGRLSGLRRTRRARRYSRTPCRSDPSGAGLARRRRQQKPPGAIAGGGFTMVNTMTSLTGASGEDFASILRSLGYRMERRPKPPEPAPAAAAPRRWRPKCGHDARNRSGGGCANRRPIAIDTETEAIGEKPDVSVPARASAARPTRHRGCCWRVAASEVAASEVASSEVGSGEVGSSEVTSSEVASSEEEAISPLRSSAALAAEAASRDASRTDRDARETAVTAEPELIEVWRPGRSERRRERPRFRHREARKQCRRAPSNRPQRRGLRAGGRRTTGLPKRSAAATGPRSRNPRQTETPSPDGTRATTVARQRGGSAVRPSTAGAGQAAGPPARYERHERREKAPDPNSPFAKLAALKAQLEAEAKGRRSHDPEK